jgi:phospholipase C
MTPHHIQSHSIRSHSRIAFLAAIALLAFIFPRSSRADGDLSKVKHVIIIMQENHSFDNYFGALALAPGSPYHQPKHEGDPVRNDHASGCAKDDHSCVDGLSCQLDISGNFVCSNSNKDENGKIVKAFHDTRRCVGPDLDHGWLSTHREANFDHPNDTLKNFLADGFVRVNDMTEQIDPPGVEDPTEDQTMNFYTESEIPFYYDLAQKFAIDDRYFSSVLGPTFPNRAFLMAATSFGHLTTSDIAPPTGGYQPVNGTIFDLLDKNNITWTDYFQDAPQATSFHTSAHFLPLQLFLTQAAAGTLPQVSFIDPNFGLAGTAFENDEHPPTDIQRGQAYVSQVVNAIRNSPSWQDSVIFITYDEHGGSYDHVRPPHAPQAGQPNPDGISPGQCADLSNPPTSLQPGGGAECHANFISNTDTSLNDAIALCPALGANPTGPYPAECANFDQLGIRVPLIAVSPFSKRHYVSHTVGDHTSLLAFIEKRFMSTEGKDADKHEDKDADSDHDDREANADSHQHLTKRDQFANPLEDLFDFDEAPSLGITLTQAAPPAVDCTPK